MTRQIKKTSLIIYIEEILEFKMNAFLLKETNETINFDREINNELNNQAEIISFKKKYNKFRAMRKKLLPFLECGNNIWTVVYQIYESELNGDTLYISNIGDLTGMPQTTVIRYLNKLSDNDLVWRIRHCNDKRMIKVRLSPKFKNQLDKLFS